MKVSRDLVARFTPQPQEEPQAEIVEAAEAVGEAVAAVSQTASAVMEALSARFSEILAPTPASYRFEIQRDDLGKLEAINALPEREAGGKSRAIPYQFVVVRDRSGRMESIAARPMNENEEESI